MTAEPAERVRGRNETEKERLDRNLEELLAELRVVLPGVQVLFAFLLTVPFAARFADVTPFQEKVYFGVLLSTAAASVLLMAPPAHHRLRFRREEKRRLVPLANRIALVGLGFLGVAMTGAILLISDFLFGTWTAAIATSLTAVLFAVVWWITPFLGLRS